MDKIKSKSTNKVLIIGMVGLPARGKSYMSRKINRFLIWSGFQPKVFNIGNYRRVVVGTNVDFNKFFDQTNSEFQKQRDECAVLALKDLCEQVNSNLVNVAILDATNTTFKRRRMVNEYLEQNCTEKYKLIWIESICDIDTIIERNIKETKIKSPDYFNWEDKGKAIEDFKERISLYEKVYQPINPNEEPGIRYIKIINQGKKIMMDNIFGFLESKIISYLVNLHTGDRAIYFSRHGESHYNTLGLIGGDSSLSENGKKYAEFLGDYFKNEFANSSCKVRLYSSTLKRAVQTAGIIQGKVDKFEDCISHKTLDEINTGKFDGMSYEEIKEKYPEEHEARVADKLNYRYSRGESYMDLIRRIEPMIFEIERSTSPMVIIGHQGMLRCLYGYFNHTPINNIPVLDIPLHTVIKFIPKDYGFFEERFYIDHETGSITKLDIQGENYQV